MATDRRGVVVSFDEGRGFGFIRPSGAADDVFVHVSDVDGRVSLRAGQRVRFAVEPGREGPRAVRVVPGRIGLTPGAGAALGVGIGVGLAAVGLAVAGVGLVPAYLLAINGMTLAVWTWDRHKAVRDGRRVPEAALLGLAALGGTVGAVLGVLLLGHKRRKPRFLLVLGLIAAGQIVLAASAWWRTAG